MTIEEFLETIDDLQLHALAYFVAGVSSHDVARRIRQQSINQAIRTTKVCYLSGKWWEMCATARHGAAF